MRFFIMIGALATFAGAATPVNAEQADYIEFYSKPIDKYWTMVGRVPTRKDNQPICFASTSGDDGKAIHITKTLLEGDWYVWMYNPNWSFSKDRDPPIRVNFYRGRNWKFVSGDIYNWNKSTKDIARILLPDMRSFFKGAVGADRFRIIMPANYNNLSGAMPPVIPMLNAFGQCTDDYNRKVEYWESELKKEEAPARKGDRYDGASPSGSKGEKI